MEKINVFKNLELNLEVRVIEGIDGTLLINAEDTAIGFGWTEKAKSGNITVRWRTINGYLREIGYFDTVATCCDDNNSQLSFRPQVGKGNYILEGYFYKLGMKAKNKTAEKFQDWIAFDVLPSIRKHGLYVTQELLKDNEKLQVELEKVKEENGILKPKAEYCDNVLKSNKGIRTTQIASNYDMKADDLNKILLKLGIIRKMNKDYTLRAKYMGHDYTLQQSVECNDGNSRPSMFWTFKGAKMIYDELKAINILPVSERKIPTKDNIINWYGYVNRGEIPLFKDEISVNDLENWLDVVLCNKPPIFKKAN